MKTAEQVLKEHSGGDGDLYEMCINAMKDYAGIVAYDCLIRVAENVRINVHDLAAGTRITQSAYTENLMEVFVDRNSITKTEIILP